MLSSRLDLLLCSFLNNFNTSEKFSKASQELGSKVGSAVTAGLNKMGETIKEHPLGSTAVAAGVAGYLLGKRKNGY